MKKFYGAQAFGFVGIARAVRALLSRSARLSARNELFACNFGNFAILTGRPREKRKKKTCLRLSPRFGGLNALSLSNLKIPPPLKSRTIQIATVSDSKRPPGSNLLLIPLCTTPFAFEGCKSTATLLLKLILLHYC